MTTDVVVHAPSCRGCELCVDICPTKVLAMDADRRLCLVVHAEDCIGCLSCAYICPSGAITHRGFHTVKNFYRDAEFCQRMVKFI
jgi:Fe-S-cluster-containing hydrogenase component 2